MTVPANTNALLLNSAAPVGYQISRSLRFNSGDSPSLSRTPGSAGNRRTWTWSCWLKRSGTSRDVLFARFSGSSGFAFEIDSSSRLWAYDYTSAFDWQLISTPVFRDPSAWYHIVFAYDTTQATASNRVKLYVNGTQVTTFSTETYPTQNFDGYVNTTSTHEIGGAFTVYLDGYLADIYFLDGTATTPSTFAETDAITGQWVPKTPTGISYGTNGFRLTFSDNSGTTSTTLGKDAAGSNNWTPNNFSVASGSGNDSLVDSPTSYGTDTGAGNEVRGNYATLNPLAAGGGTLSNGNLDLVGPSSAYGSRFATIGVSSGKWYCEATTLTNTSSQGFFCGVTRSFNSSYIGSNSDGYGYHSDSGNKYNNASASSYGASYATDNNVIGIALDLDAGTLTFYKNGVSQGTAYSSLPSGTYYFGISCYNTQTGCFNAGQRPFSYSAPSGFKALCDTNLTAPTIAKPANYFDVKLYTGNGSGQTVSGLAFGPDLVWIKNRVDAEVHALFDQVRGADLWLSSNLTDAETNYGGGFGVTAFTSSGFTVGTGTAINGNNEAHVAWAWDAASSNSTNTSGTITSTVRANATAGFSVVSWTSDGSSSIRTMGHGLGATPALVIIKNRDISDNWTVYHSSFSNIVRNYIFLNSTAAVATRGIDLWSTFSSTTFGLDQTFVAANGQKCIAYCFAPVAGYSAFGSYTGNGSSDGPFVFTGFRPRWLLVKRSDSTSDWIIYDAARDTYNVMGKSLYPSLSNAEIDSPPRIDFLSNGFKLRVGGSSEPNWSSSTVIYACFAESPFQYARAR